ncbi:MAG: hypothetical protein JNL69_07150 [Bacteroidia bacterium]|nr:hypothetical protein [Bacteroidia bacterium]
MQKIKIYSFGIVFFLFVINSFSQTTVDSTYISNFKFIKIELNKIENDSTSLVTFYSKLVELEKSKKGVVKIVHIGDSHIQADGLSGTVRQKFQLKFGNAGRGLIFPYRLAKSNEPTSYKTSTNTAWNYKRNVFYEKPLPIGISGYTIETADSAAEINVLVKNQNQLGYAFNKLSLFHEKGKQNYDISVCDELNCERGVFSYNQTDSTSFVSELKFDKPIQQVYLRNKKTDTLSSKYSRIYGMLLENDSSGVLYNMIGVNGAEYRHYSLSKYFKEQLTYLSPDLIIVSLGTNEAYATSFNKDAFYGQIDTLITSLKASNPNAVFLLSTPPDSYRRTKNGRLKNSDMKLAKETIIKYAVEHNIAYWNLYEVMGGYGSMQNWYLAKLSAKDKVHFTGLGYQMQGYLLYKALIEDNYEKYKLKSIEK